MFPNRKLYLEPLEERKLLAVTVNFNPGSGLLSISGDAAGDEVRVEGLGRPGGLEIEINNVLHGSFNAVRRVNASLGAGDDTLHVGALQIGSSLSINMGAGKDEFDLDTTTSPTGLSVNGPAFIGGSVTINMGGDAADYIDWDTTFEHGITIGGNVTLSNVADVDLDGDGSSPLAQAIDIAIGGNVVIGLTSFGDANGDGESLSLKDVNFGGTTTINGSSTADVVRINNSNFARRLNVNLGGGADRLLFGSLPDRNFFADRVTLNAGSGIDTLDENIWNNFLVPPIVSNFEDVV